MKKMRNKKPGFTLAEILITLSIIGVVAALTIPTLIQRTGNEELVSRLQKTYSTLSQATEAIMTENGGVISWMTNIDSVYGLYKTHLRNSRDCGSNTGCWKQGEIKKLNGLYWGNNWDSRTDNRRLILSDGTSIQFSGYSFYKKCNGKESGSNDVCMVINADINGEKQPNTVGRDIFFFVLKENGVYPAGCDDETKADCNNDGIGGGCACKIISEGAMNY